MYDFAKRFLIALIMMIFIGILMIGGKAIHAADNSYWLWPVNGIITSEFHDRAGEHNGIDIAAPKGIPVVAAKAGIVKKSYHSASYGNVIFLLHKNGYETVYAHLNRRFVGKGDHVAQGEEIGSVGSTGHSTGPHLHFEVHHGLWNIHKTNAVNPVLVLGEVREQQVIRTRGAAVSSGNKRKAQSKEAPESNANKKDKLVLSGSVSGKHSQVENKGETGESGTEMITITVEKGDTLWELAHQYNVTVSLLKEWNNLSSDLLKVGLELKLYPETLETYKVQSGDTLSSIAAKIGTSVRSLIKYNHLKGSTIFPSEVLITEIHK
ncbi:MAG TPA: peptidoglycan DD-metalloendopeptidase family protein [Bacillales bacterium]